MNRWPGAADCYAGFEGGPAQHPWNTGPSLRSAALALCREGKVGGGEGGEANIIHVMSFASPGKAALPRLPGHAARPFLLECPQLTHRDVTGALKKFMKG